MLDGRRVRSEQQTANESGDISAAVQSLGDGETRQRQGHHGQLKPNFGDPSVIPAELEYPCAHRSQPEADHQPDTDFLGHQLDSEGGAAPARVGAQGQGDEQKQDGDTDTVVEAALDVEALPDAGRHGLVGDHGLSERGVSRGEHRREDGDREHGELVEQQQAGAESERDGQRQAEQQHPAGNREATFDYAQIGVRGVDEQHQGKRNVRQNAQPDVVEFGLQPAEPDRTYDQPHDRKDHGAADHGLLETACDRAVQEDEDGE